MILNEFYRVREWLMHHDYFSDCHLDYELKNDLIKLTVEKIESGENIAETFQTVKTIFISCKNSKVIPYSNQEIESKKNGSQLMQLLPFDNMVGFNVFLWENGFYVFADEIEVLESESFQKKIVPKVDYNSITLTLKKENIPNDTFWLLELKKINYPSEYFGYFGDVAKKSDYKELGYVNYCIRPKNYISNFNSIAIQFCLNEIDPFLFNFKIELQNSELLDFWEKFLTLISKLDFVEFKTGNVILNYCEGIDYLNTKILPIRFN